MTDTTQDDMRQQMEHAGVDPSVSGLFAETQLKTMQRSIDELSIKMTLGVSLQAIAGLRWQTEQWIAGASGVKTPEETEAASAWYEDHYASLEQAWQEWAYAELAKIAEKYAGGEEGGR
jgi:hypothetical protein